MISLTGGLRLLVLIFICSIGAVAQTTTVTGPIIDPSGNTWSVATVHAVFVPTPNVPGPYVWSGGAFNTNPPTVTTDAGGNFTLTLPSNTSITPSGSSWQIITGPNATTSAAIASVMLSGGSLDISTAYTAASGWPTTRINPTPITTVYNTNQTLPPPTGQGGMVYNTTNQTMEVFTSTGWQPFATVGDLPVITNPAGNQTIVQPPGTTLNVNSLNTVIYANNYATPQLAIAAACNGTTPGTVVFPVGITVVNNNISVPANCILSGDGDLSTILQSSVTNPSPIFSISANNVTLSNLTLDGNRFANSHVVDCVGINSAANVKLIGTTILNCNNNGLLIDGNSSNITIQTSEFHHTGPANPGSQGTAGINIGSGTVSNVLITNSRIHDNSSGIIITNTGTIGSDVGGISITNNKIYSNGNDAILATISNLSGGNITGLQVSSNEIYCNGWATGGISANCTPGFQQTGGVDSQGGVGVDLIQQGFGQVLRPLVNGNYIHDNVFEAVSPTTNLAPIVSTSGNAVTWVSGPTFSLSLISGQTIFINGTSYLISSVASSTSLTLQSSAGVQTSVGTLFPEYMGATISNNIAYLDGNAARVVGPCFYNQLSDGNTYTANLASECALSGFENYYSNFLTYNGDKAYSNDTSSVVNQNAGFLSIRGLGLGFINIGTQDTTSSPTQTVGVLLNNCSNVFITSQSLLAVTPVLNIGSVLASTILNSYPSFPAMQTQEIDGFPGMNTALNSGSQVQINVTPGSGTTGVGFYSGGAVPTEVAHITGTGYMSAVGGYQINGVPVIPVVGTPTAGQAACIKAAGPPVVIGYCSTVVGATGACTCN